MEEWFTVESIDKDTFAISEYKHWEETHCYLLCGTKNAVLIDTGLGVGNVKEIVDKLTDLPVMVVSTHVHWDHIGGHKYFSHIAVNEIEKEWLADKFPLPLQAVKQNLLHYPCDFPKEFSIDKYTLFQAVPTKIFNDGDSFDLGGRTLFVIHTPGHSPGHCCFYEIDRKYLYSGDLIYCGCLDMFYPTTDPELFFQSIKKIEHFNIDKILPGHHSLNVPIDIIHKIDKAFCKLKIENQLQQGKGIFDFSEFQIHI